MISQDWVCTGGTRAFIWLAGAWKAVTAHSYLPSYTFTTFLVPIDSFRQAEHGSTSPGCISRKHKNTNMRPKIANPPDPTTHPPPKRPRPFPPVFELYIAEGMLKPFWGPEVVTSS